MLAVTSLLMGCYGCPPPPPEIDPVVTQLEILPKELTARDGAIFEILVRAKDVHGHVLRDAEAANVAWSGDPGLSIVPPAKGQRITLKVSAPVSVPIDAMLKAALGSVSATATIRIVGDPATGEKADWISTDRELPDLPAIAMVDGQNATEWRKDSVIAFVGMGRLDEFGPTCTGTNCGELSVFAPGMAVGRSTAAWENGCEHRRFTSAPAVPPVGECAGSVHELGIPAKVSYTLWIATGESGAQTNAMVDASLAAQLFTLGRSGLTFLSNVGGPQPWPIDLLIEASCGGANPVRKALEDVGVASATFGPARVNVAYVNRVDLSVGGTPSPVQGFTCPWNSTDGSIVLVSARDRLASTLAHELGHALGPWQSGSYGHTDGVPGLDGTNLMWSYASNALPLAQWFLTLGQVFRISLESGSVLNRGAGLTAGIKCADEELGDRPCPELAKDVRSP